MKKLLLAVIATISMSCADALDDIYNNTNMSAHEYDRARDLFGVLGGGLNAIEQKEIERTKKACDLFRHLGKKLRTGEIEVSDEELNFYNDKFKFDKLTNCTKDTPYVVSEANLDKLIIQAKEMYAKEAGKYSRKKKIETINNWYKKVLNENFDTIMYDRRASCSPDYLRDALIRYRLGDTNQEQFVIEAFNSQCEYHIGIFGLENDFKLPNCNNNAFKYILDSYLSDGIGTDSFNIAMDLIGCSEEAKRSVNR